MNNFPKFFQLFLLFILVIIPMSSIITVYQDIDYLTNVEAHPIYEFVAYSKTTIKIIIIGYCLFTSYLLSNRKKNSYINALLVTCIIFIAPFLIEVPFLIMEQWVNMPSYVVKDIVVILPFTSIFFIVFMSYLLKSEWVKKQFKNDTSAQQKMKTIINIGLSLNLIPITGITYFYYLYFSNKSNSLRHEYLEGVAITMVFTWPLWLSLAGFGIWKRQKIKSTQFALTLAPAIIMLGGIILFELL